MTLGGKGDGMEVEQNKGRPLCTQHLAALNAAMMGTVTRRITDDDYANLLNIGYALYYDLANAERRIHELETK